jgi:hypothetical protein
MAFRLTHAEHIPSELGEQLLRPRGIRFSLGREHSHDQTSYRALEYAVGRPYDVVQIPSASSPPAS